MKYGDPQSNEVQQNITKIKIIKKNMKNLTE
jgi:hypothetical protein